jgi:non-specific serine/threonine protein kinase
MREVAMATGTSYRPPGTLPSQASGFVGREAELSRVRDLRRRSWLVTITGTGGVGKTRLALRAAAEATGFPDGVHLIELSAVRDCGLLAPALAATLAIPGAAQGSQLDEFIAAGEGRYERTAWLFGAAAPLDEAVARALSDTGTFDEPA